jgi:hypothetical protein
MWNAEVGIMGYLLTVKACGQCESGCRRDFTVPSNARKTAPFRKCAVIGKRIITCYLQGVYEFMLCNTALQTGLEMENV